MIPHEIQAAEVLIHSETSDLKKKVENVTAH